MAHDIELNEPSAQHTLLIVVGALIVLWLLGAIAFKGVRQ